MIVIVAAAGVGSAAAMGTVILAGPVVITEGLTVDTDTLVVDSVNDRVGIGTNVPVRQLTVFDANPQIRLGQDSSKHWDLWGGFDLNFQKGGDTKVFFKDNGNVGIGTTSPDSKLDVNGVLTLQSSLDCPGGACVGGEDITDGSIQSADLSASLNDAIAGNKIQTYITVHHVAGFDKFWCTSTADYTLDIYMSYQPGASYVMTLKDGVTAFSYGTTHSDTGVDGFTIGGLAGLDHLIDLSGSASPIVGYITLRTDPSATSGCVDE